MLLGEDESSASSPDFSDMTRGREGPCYLERVSTWPVLWAWVGPQFYLWFLPGVEWLLLKTSSSCWAAPFLSFGWRPAFLGPSLCPWHFCGASFCSTLPGICEVKESPGEPPDCLYSGLTIPSRSAFSPPSRIFSCLTYV